MQADSCGKYHLALLSVLWDSLDSDLPLSMCCKKNIKQGSCCTLFDSLGFKLPCCATNSCCPLDGQLLGCCPTPSESDDLHLLGSCSVLVPSASEPAKGNRLTLIIDVSSCFIPPRFKSQF